MKVNTPVRRWRWLAAPVAAVAAVLLATTPALAGTAQIQDDANVLNATTVQNEAATLPVGVYVWTTTQDAASKSTFDTDVRTKVGTTFPVVIGINTQAHHTSVQIGRHAGLSQSAALSAARSANDAFDSAMRGKPDYTAATVSALDSLRGSLGSARHGGGAASPSSSGSSGAGIFVLIVLAIIVLAVVFGALRLLRGRSGPRPMMVPGPPMGGGYPGPGYGPGYGPQYGPGYGRSGMSPGAAGAMGAVGGGLLGYELGKMEGEREGDRYDDRGYDGGGQGYDNGGGQGDWTVGQDSDFGGGGDSGGGGFDGGGGGGGGDW